MQQRAQVGGQTGANGEWYEGGKFIATTEQPKGKPAKTTATRKEQYEPYKWAVAPEQGQRPIYAIAGVWTKTNRTGQMEFVANEKTVAHYGDTFQGYKITELIEMWNNGVRWVTPN